jgi:hypothetical protein
MKNQTSMTLHWMTDTRIFHELIPSPVSEALEEWLYDALHHGFQVFPQFQSLGERQERSAVPH